MKWATFTDAVPGVDDTVGHYQPRGLVSWTRAVDPYTFFAPQITIAAKREPFEIDQFDRVQTLLRTHAVILYRMVKYSCMRTRRYEEFMSVGASCVLTFT